MHDKGTTTFMLLGVPVVILVGIALQIAVMHWQGPDHRFSFWYTGLMAILFLSNLAALVLHLIDKTKMGISLAAWVGLLCITAMVGLDTLVDITDGLPWVVLTLYLAVYAIGEVVGGRQSVLYSIFCGAVLFAVGIAQRKIDDAVPLLMVLLLVTVWARRQFYVGWQLERHRAALEIVTHGRRGRTTSGID
jgi:hypothetical protein